MNDDMPQPPTGPHRSLADSEYRALAEAVPQLLWTASADGVVYFLSEQWSTFTGVPLQELRSMQRQSLVHPEDLPAVVDAWEASRRNGAPLEVSFRLRHASGTWRWQLSRGVPMRDDAGRIERWVGTLTDIHDQVTAEQDAELLDEIGERCRRSTDEGGLLAHVTERIGKYLGAQGCLFAELEVGSNLAHVRCDFHPTGGSLGGTYPLDSFGGPTVAAALAGQTAAVSDTATDQRTAAHYESYRRLGARAYISAPVSVKGERRGVFVVLAHEPRVWTAREIHLVETAGDRTWLAVERLRDTTALLEARANAEAANRMKDEFLATVSHELRAPLNAIGGWAGVLRVGKLDATGITKAATVIEKNVRAQAKMIEDLLDVSRIVSGRLRLEVRSFDPAVAVEGALESLRATAAGREIQIEYTKSLAPSSVSGDPNRLQQAVWNVISNAVKFSEPGGRITVALSDRDGNAEITVADSGAGIEPEFLPQLFERFRQADGSNQRRFGGLGLGLAIVRHIVELHGGTVAAHSEGAGKGATFILRIPLSSRLRQDGIPAEASASDAAGRPRGSRATAGALAGLRLLTVDDEADASEMLKAALEQYGAQVTTVASAAAALDILERERFDVLLSDIGMPGMNGYELLERIRGGAVHARAIPAIAVTGYARTEDRERALKAGYRAHVVKPIEPEELAATVRAAARSP